MKSYVIFLVIFLSLNLAYAQENKRMSDIEFEGLKGKVKNLRYESIYYENGSGLSKIGEFYTIAKFDEDGNMLEETAFEKDIPIRKTSVWREGDYTFKRFEKLNSALTQSSACHCQ